MRSTLATLLIAACAELGHAANWAVTRVNHAFLTPPTGVTVTEMSGITYVGEVDGLSRFIAAEETKGELIQFDLAFSPAGGIAGVSNITPIDIVATNDFEGIAYTNAARNSVFLASENGVGLREVSLTTGANLQNVTLPAVFANARANLSFESLTRAADGRSMWTANEQALTADGLPSTPTAGTTVRLLELSVIGNAVTPARQFAYVVDPIHGSSTLGTPQSGLSDLALMPDGTLLALERSVALATPIYRSRIYEVDVAGATDVSVAPLDTGLTGKSFTAVGKSLLWSGAVDAASGQNMEGLTLGPRLPNGDWSLIGVVDNGDGASGNTLVAFTAHLVPSADFNADGAIDGADFLQWQRGAGLAANATHQEGDANLDGKVDAADLNIWKAAFGGPAAPAVQPIPEPIAATLAIIALAAIHPRIKKPRSSIAGI
ncbi:esterase-like activity of phytase family protein [Lacipirellula sp.]|uniref:esterase-like activity of phytase family protein n=1 Tax=Lacipirellula sp. TaxID=2691419 RepID=UPI003D0FDC59